MARANQMANASSLGPSIKEDDKPTTVVSGGSIDSLPVIPPEAILVPASVGGESFEETKPGDRVSKRYRVVNERSISAGGYRTTLHAGKVISDGQYNVDSLLSQGVKLEEVTAD